MVLAIGASLLSACSGTSQSDIDKAKAAGASEEAARQKQKRLEDEQARIAAELKKLQQESAQAKSQAATPGPAVAPPGRHAGTTGAGTGRHPLRRQRQRELQHQLCVRRQRQDRVLRGGTNTIDVYSPTAGRYCSMRCVAGVPTVCRGGNNALVDPR
ncbi:MAG: hypothetical protein H7270_13080 [Dermatophilaceae bacterium]|nr:hypothetical protein [Dermatophilaceae bacterium]